MLCGGSIVNVLLLLLVPIVGGIPPIVPTSTMRAPSTHGATQFAAVYNGAMYLPVLLPEELEVTAWTDTGIIMGVRHKRFPVEGVQFHPESIMTSVGKDLLSNFLKA